MDNDVFHIDETGFTGDFGGETAIPTSYEDLGNKPSINGVELSGNKTTEDLGINIPGSLADLQDDAEHRTVTDDEKSAWNGKADPSAIPAKVSDLTNDAGYQDAAEVNAAVNSLLADDSEKEEQQYPVTIFNAKNGGESTIKIYGNPQGGNDADNIFLRWGIPNPQMNYINQINVGFLSYSTEYSVAPFRTIDDKAIDASGNIYDASGSKIYIFPIQKNHKYYVYNNFSDTPWLSTLSPFSNTFASMSKVTMGETFINASYRCILVSSFYLNNLAIYDVTENPVPGDAWTGPCYIDTEFRWHIPGDGVIQPQYIRDCGLIIENGIPKFYKGSNCTRFVVDLKDITWTEKTDGLIDGYFTFPVNANYSSSNDLTRKTSASAVASANNSYWVDSSGEHKHIRIHIDNYASYTLEQAIAAIESAGMTIAIAHYDNESVEVTYTQPNVPEASRRPVGTVKGANYYASNFFKLDVSFQKDSAIAFDKAYQIPDAPSANGTYVLKCTKTAQGTTFAWVAE